MSTYPRIRSVMPMSNKRLQVRFVNGVVKVYDCQPLLTQPAFLPLKDEVFFKNVRVDETGYGVIWNDHVDLSESELWLNGISVSSS